nr:calmodulin binding protein PICBP [Ipomoea batatas]GMD95815.1 calmodulin binding protein PICBP [Ipomoea batatas]GME18079.1 calmodulin binding protein PICBP [Ipomoea batatas]
MKSTSSSDARKERSPSSSGAKSGQNPARASTKTTSLRALTKAPSFKPARAKKCSQVVMCEDLEVQRATCSSTLKDSKFPCYLELSPGGTESQGTSAMKVCPYTYCSLNGHHRLPLPPLKCFVSARRRALKAQRSFKIGCLSPRRSKPSAGEEENMEFSVEIFCKERADEDDEYIYGKILTHSASMAAEELRYECLSEEDHDSDMEGMEDSALFIDAGVSEETGFTIDEISDEKSFDEETTQSSISCLESSSFCVYVEETTQVSDEEMCRENMIPPEDQESNDSNDSICSDCVQQVHNVDEGLMVEVKKTQKMASENQILDLELPNLRGTAKNRRETEEELGEFNPRGPNFLPLEPDPEAERVSLKHQSMDERKNGEEWMVDYALRQAVSKLAPARRKKVALLVEAFETVSPIPKYESHLSHSTKLFPPPSRSIQACS